MILVDQFVRLHYHPFIADTPWIHVHSNSWQIMVQGKGVDGSVLDPLNAILVQVAYMHLACGIWFLVSFLLPCLICRHPLEPCKDILFPFNFCFRPVPHPLLALPPLFESSIPRLNIVFCLRFCGCIQLHPISCLVPPTTKLNLLCLCKNLALFPQWPTSVPPVAFSL